MRKIVSNLLTCFVLSVIILGVLLEDSNINQQKEFFPVPDTVYAKYFPLIVGNTYTYIHYNYYQGQTGVTRAVITKDTIISGKKYFYCQNFPYIGSGWVRFDTASGNLLRLSISISCSIYTNEIILDSMRSKPNNQVNCLGFLRCSDTTSVNLFNQNQLRSINFVNDGIVYQQTRYTIGFGISSGCSGEPPPCESYYYLKGCKINGVVYGDTTLTEISKTGNYIPGKYSLSQNYPNPFNPYTKISYRIPKNSFVILKIYDILGKEVATLVNEKLNAGEFETSFDGSSLPSGVYFYKLFSGDFAQIKKMVLLK